MYKAANAAFKLDVSQSIPLNFELNSLLVRKVSQLECVNLPAAGSIFDSHFGVCTDEAARGLILTKGLISRSVTSRSWKTRDSLDDMYTGFKPILEESFSSASCKDL
jgi:hypothetical protein